MLNNKTMSKEEIIERLNKKHTEYCNNRNNCLDIIKNLIGTFDQLQEIHIGNLSRYTAICRFYSLVIQKIESDGYELKNALFATTNEMLFEESFIKPRNPIEQGLYLYELEGYRMAILTIKKDFNI